MCINKTHLKDWDTIELTGYTWFGFNRPARHVNAPKAFGGIGIFAKHILFSSYNIHIVDKSIDGVLGLQFVDKLTNYTCIIYCCYLPPDKFVWSDCTDFFGLSIAQLYMHSYADSVYVCGNFNARTGSLVDISEEDTDVLPRISFPKSAMILGINW